MGTSGKIPHLQESDSDSASSTEPSDVDEFSSDDGDSDASDVFHVLVEPERTWETPQDFASRSIRRLSAELRDKPLLPPVPKTREPEESWKRVKEGIRLPVPFVVVHGRARTLTTSRRMHT